MTNLEKGYDEVETDLQIPNLAATINELKGKGVTAIKM